MFLYLSIPAFGRLWKDFGRICTKFSGHDFEKKKKKKVSEKKSQQRPYLFFLTEIDFRKSVWIPEILRLIGNPFSVNDSGLAELWTEIAECKPG